MINCTGKWCCSTKFNHWKTFQRLNCWNYRKSSKLHFSKVAKFNTIKLKLQFSKVATKCRGVFASPTRCPTARKCPTRLVTRWEIDAFNYSFTHLSHPSVYQKLFTEGDYKGVQGHPKAKVQVCAQASLPLRPQGEVWLRAEGAVPVGANPELLRGAETALRGCAEGGVPSGASRAVPQGSTAALRDSCSTSLWESRPWGLPSRH